MPRPASYFFRLIHEFSNDEAGFIISAELVLIASLCVLGLITGLTCIKSAISGEMNDIAAAFRGLDQSYYYSGFHGCRSCKCGFHSYTAGSSYFQENRERERATFLEIEQRYLHDQEEFKKSCQGCTSKPVPPKPPVPEAPVPVIPCPPAVPYSNPIIEQPPQMLSPVPEYVPATGSPCGPTAIQPGTVIDSFSQPGSIQTYPDAGSCGQSGISYFSGSITGPSSNAACSPGISYSGQGYVTPYATGRIIINPDSAYQGNYHQGCR